MIRRGLMIAWLALSACQSQGDYTSAAEEEARAGMSALRAGTEYDEASRQYATGDLDRALKTVNNSIELSPDVAKTHLLRSKILIELNDSISALSSLDRAAELDPNNAEYPYLRGVVKEQLGLRDEALLEYEAAAELGPDEAAHRLALAETLVQLERLDEARSLLEGDSGPFAANAGFRQMLGHIALLEDDPEEAKTRFTEAAILGPRDAAILEDLLRSQIATSDYVGALRSLEHLEELDALRSRPDLRRMQAQCHILERQPVEARGILIKLTTAKDGPRDFESWRLLADVALMLEDERLLRSTADRMLQAEPSRPEGFLTLALWQRQSGDLDAALRSVRNAAERDTDQVTSAVKLEALIEHELKGQTTQGG